MRTIQLRFTRRATDSKHLLVTAYEFGDPIHTAPLVEMTAWLALRGFIYVPGSKAVWCVT